MEILKSLEPHGRIIGYVPFTPRPEEELRRANVLLDAGCHPDHLHIEKTANHRSTRRPALAAMKLDYRRGDVIAFVSFLAAVSGFKAMADFLDWAQERGAPLVFIEIGWDTRASTGQLLVAGLRIYLDSQIRSHSASTRWGLDEARKMGRTGGRPNVLDAYDLSRAQGLIDAGGSNMAEIAHMLGVTRATLYNAGLAARKKLRPPQ